MVKMEKLKELIKIVLLTGYIKNEQPVSLLLIAEPDSGKSSLMSRVVTNRGILELTDISAWGISQMIAPLIDKNIEIKHIIIPDFLVVLSKSKSTAERTITFINSLTEEGIANIGTYLNRGIEFKVSDKVRNTRVRAGIITALTPDEYNKKKKKMNQFGFLSRFLVVRYEYSTDYLDRIFKEIWNGNYLHREEELIEFPKEMKEVKIIENDFLYTQIKLLAKNKIDSGNVSGTGGRQVRMFKNLLQAIALKNGHNEVIQSDFEEFLSFESLINYSGRKVEPITL